MRWKLLMELGVWAGLAGASDFVLIPIQNRSFPWNSKISLTMMNIMNLSNPSSQYFECIRRDRARVSRVGDIRGGGSLQAGPPPNSLQNTTSFAPGEIQAPRTLSDRAFGPHIV